MFINQSKLCHELPPISYTDETQYRNEIESLFQSRWLAIGTVADAANDGDFFTRDLFGKPILVRNFGGVYRCFLNVCPHRHSMLTSQSSGHSEVLKCQYHGWEFTESGRTGKIPDAKSFRPLPGGPECLQAFPIQVVGALIFVSLSSTQDSLDSLIQPFRGVIEEFPVARWKQAESWTSDFPANWKIVAENTVESYHLDSVHSKTLVAAAPEEEIEHEIHDNGTVMRSTIIAPSLYYRIADRVLPWLESGCSHQYRLYHLFPNLFFIRIDAMLQVMILFPTSPTTCRMHVSVFTLRSKNETMWTRMLTKWWGRLKVSSIKTILAEDAAIYPDLQRGMEHSPFHGSISTREELVHALQLFIKTHAGLISNVGDGGDDGG